MQEIKVEELKIDDELRDLLPPLSKDEFEGLEKLIVDDGKLFSPIIIWQGYIVDGHNRYKICKKHNIDFSKNVVSLGYETKDDVKKWMLDTQLGRRNLTPIQKISIAEKYRPLYEKRAKENQGNRNDLKNNFPQISAESETQTKSRDNEVRTQLANIAGVSHDTYSKGAKILYSNNEEVKTAVVNGDMSINAGYNELVGKNKKKDKIKKEIISDNITPQLQEDKNTEIPSRPQTKICNKCKQEKPIDKFPNGYSLCDECLKDPYKPVERDYAAEVTGEGEDWDIIRDLKTPKIVADCVSSYDVNKTIQNFEEDFTDNIEELEKKIFITYQLHNILTQEDKEHYISVLNISTGKILKLINKIKEIEIKGE